MNEQIKKLLGQALDSAVPETWTTLTPEQLAKVSHKLAELIIRECAKVAFNDWCEGTNEESSQMAILKHFGVEE